MDKSQPITPTLAESGTKDTGLNETQENPSEIKQENIMSSSSNSLDKPIDRVSTSHSKSKATLNNTQDDLSGNKSSTNPNESKDQRKSQSVTFLDDTTDEPGLVTVEGFLASSSNSIMLDVDKLEETSGIKQTNSSFLSPSIKRDTNGESMDEVRMAINESDDPNNDAVPDLKLKFPSMMTIADELVLHNTQEGPSDEKRTSISPKLTLNKVSSSKLPSISSLNETIDELNFENVGANSTQNDPKDELHALSTPTDAPELTEILNRIQQKLQAGKNRGKALERTITHFKDMMMNETIKELTTGEDEENSKKVIESNNNKLVGTLHRICVRIMEHGIEDLAFDELRFMHEEIYLAARKLIDNNPEVRLLNDISNMRKHMNILNNEIRVVHHVLRCHRPKY